MRQQRLGSPEAALRNPASKYRYTRRLFATIADRYDLITRVLSFGRDQAWKRRLIRLAGVGAGWRVLDLACGTGDLAILAVHRRADVTGLDFTPRMIELARRRPEGSRVVWVVGDMGRLPVRSKAFDAITTGYGLRNVPDLPAALAEMRRVLRDPGVLCALDFDRPESAVVRAVYLAFLTAAGSALGYVLHHDPDTYRYIPASIRRYPGARGVADLMRDAGFADVTHVPVLGGLMAIHVARTGGAAVPPGAIP
jgi:demethylmenaquinone methyltransferase/2-methoxy-6-polyprenyl-1,4-benzoquinol methylase